ncbi:MAG: hypothetical protein D5R97_01775 [Candidatus Syntrophonatronum acetioxidans]|uniref:Uncharacterized protein n=1 Tax=Candidatus Syntrophonatronum acetioxidans TaxID=1795816 RepID=A0A424YHL9_9FIRM|nr:MAG: hypothetical protein D5R97_01775 [Candidatus Syntrophonatronum acetioxidans]
MGDNFLEIKLSSKAILFLYERELLDNLPPELYKKGLQRGKGILRSRQAQGRKLKPSPRDMLPTKGGDSL